MRTTVLTCFEFVVKGHDQTDGHMPILQTDCKNCWTCYSLSLPLSLQCSAVKHIK